MKYPLEAWTITAQEYIDLNDIKDKSNAYQYIVNIILKNEIFQNIDFYEENTSIILTKLFPESKKIENKIVPDFLIPKIPKDIFLKIVKKYDYMFRYDEKWNSLDDYKFINIIGETKINIKNIKMKQKDNYIFFCKDLNEMQKSKENKDNYFMTMYIFDGNYKLFWLKEFIYNNSIIIGYIPQLFNIACLNYQKKLKNEFEEHEKFINRKIIIKEENITFPKIDKEKQDFDKNKNESAKKKEQKEKNNQFEEEKKLSEARIELSNEEYKLPEKDKNNEIELLEEEDNKTIPISNDIKNLIKKKKDLELDIKKEYVNMDISKKKIDISEKKIDISKLKVDIKKLKIKKLDFDLLKAKNNDESDLKEHEVPEAPEKNKNIIDPKNIKDDNSKNNIFSMNFLGKKTEKNE